jgi:hypothetical protein
MYYADTQTFALHSRAANRKIPSMALKFSRKSAALNQHKTTESNA